MKRGNYFDRNNTMKDIRKLPKGAYVCKIINAKVDENQYGSRLVLAFDIIDGEYTGYFKEKYDANRNEDKKWPGVVRVSIPAEDGSDEDAFRIRNFNTALVAIEDSNPGYTWDWDEKHLKDKKLGVVFNLKEFIGQNGQKVEFTQAKRVTSIQSVIDGTFYQPKDELLDEQAAAAPADNSWISTTGDDDELPFA